ncbi:glycosyltransferase [Phyllobacterium sp. 22552]|uniref:glycosyltransferase n=1 Tax=Phyllobacterium sp. 22552 TaxID=3453941 RepID=UPI003F848D88
MNSLQGISGHIRRATNVLHFAGRKLLESVRIFGIRKTLLRIFGFAINGTLWSLIAKRRASLLSSATDESKAALSTFYPVSEGPSASEFMTRRVLIVAEMSIPQCKKYRVDQKAELFAELDIETKIVNWTDFDKVRNLLQSYPIVIFYRVPAVPDVILLANECKRLGIRTFWEVDDLIFDPEGYSSNTNLQRLDSHSRNSLLDGMKLYREALLLCDEGIGSTKVIAQVMTETTGRPAYVIENALDADTIRIAENIRDKVTKRVPFEDGVTIVYGSGTKTHDVDFLCASEAIYNVLAKRANVKLRIIGELNIESRFGRFAHRIERIPFTTFEGYLETIASADISIAPLENSIFNNAKSNIKFLEASIVGLPTVCSPAEAFSSVIVDGETGLLASSPTEWEQALLSLVDDPVRASQIGENAYRMVRQIYAPENIANQQLASLVSTFASPNPNVTRILLANIYFSPQSYGGATIVVEEIAQRFAANKNVEVYIFTSWSNTSAGDYDLVRYSAKGATVFATKVPIVRNRLMDIKDYTMGQVFKEVLKSIKPDIVQLHSIQTLGVELATVCNDFDIPYTVTLHDAWWLCERQFMVTGDNKFCNQQWIDPQICSSCVQDSQFNRDRSAIVLECLHRADGIISPSAYFKELHIQNGFEPERISVNKNGIKKPLQTYKRHPSDRIRFGYVGGATPIKGYELVRKAFSDLPPCNVELVLVDNTLNQGRSTVDLAGLNASNPVRVVPAYTQETIDEFFSQIDVLLFPSQWKESFGLTVREALIRDVWVIVTEAGGATEDIVPGENGDIIPISNNSIHLKNAMENVIQKREFLKTYSNPYKDNIQSFDNQAAELFGYLENVIARHKMKVA